MAYILVFGHLTIDDIVSADGRTQIGAVGGNAVYAAAGARLWTPAVRMVARLGAGYPEAALHMLTEGGQDLSGLAPVALPHIHQWALYDSEGGRNYIRLRSAPTYMEMMPSPGEIPVGVANGATHAHIAPLPLAGQVDLVRWARGRGLVVTLDPHHESLNEDSASWQKVLAGVDLFLPSREEAEVLLGGEVSDPSGAVRRLARLGCPRVVLKLGAAGAVAYDARHDRTVSIPSLPGARPVDTTGCGDAFCGGVIAGLFTGAAVDQAIRMGTVAASFAMEEFGAGGVLHADPSAASERLKALKREEESHAR